MFLCICKVYFLWLKEKQQIIKLPILFYDLLYLFNLFYLFVLKRLQWWDIIAKEVILETLIIHFPFASSFHLIFWIQNVHSYGLW